MLLNILPGFRELRAPLATGYLWLLAGWLALGDSISLPDEAQDFLDQFSGLGEAAALSFAAYIVGALLTDASGPFWNRYLKLRRDARLFRWRRKQIKQAEEDEQAEKYTDQRGEHTTTDSELLQRAFTYRNARQAESKACGSLRRRRPEPSGRTTAMAPWESW